MGSTNSVQYTDDLADSAWTDLPGNLIARGLDSFTNKVDTSAGSAPQRFYRVRRLP